MTIHVTDPQAMPRVKAWIDKILNGHRTAMDAGSEASAKHMHRALRSNIASGGMVQPISQMTKTKRRIGKLAGVTPAIPPYPGVSPLLRSGKLMQALEVVRNRPGEWQVSVRPGVGDQGQDLRGLAELMEYGKVVTINMTRRMQVYLRVLAEGRHMASRATAGERDDTVIRTLTVVIPPRPIWRKTFESQDRASFDAFVKAFAQYLKLDLLGKVP